MLENLRYLTSLGILFLMKRGPNLVVFFTLKCLTSSTGNYVNIFIAQTGSYFLF